MLDTCVLGELTADACTAVTGRQDAAVLLHSIDVVLPFLMNTAGWFLTESGRQPWIVQGLMLTKNGISPTLSTTWLWISLIAFIVIYGTIATVDLLLMLKYSRKELPPPRADADADLPLPAVQY
jgi:cytochrome d ubiquinol oxidase subunit I